MAAAGAPQSALLLDAFLAYGETVVWHWQPAPQASPTSPRTPPPAASSPPAHLFASELRFCRGAELSSERPSVHAFTTTEGDGGRRYGYVVAWLESDDADAAPCVLALLSRRRAFGFFEALLLLLHERLATARAAEDDDADATAAGATGAARLAARGAACVPPVLAALVRRLDGGGASATKARRLAAAENSELAGALGLLFAWLRRDPSRLLTLLLAVLLEERILLHSAHPPVLFAAAEALACIVAPLPFCGVAVPLLPEGVHGDAEALLADAVQPFVIGVPAPFFAQLRPSLDPTVFAVDVDAGSVVGGGAAATRFDTWLKLPPMQAAAAALRAATDGAAVQAACAGVAAALGDLRRSPLRTPDGTAAERLHWERISAAARFADALIYMRTSQPDGGGAPAEEAVRLVLAEQIDAAFTLTAADISPPNPSAPPPTPAQRGASQTTQLSLLVAAVYRSRPFKESLLAARGPVLADGSGSGGVGGGAVTPPMAKERSAEDVAEAEAAAAALHEELTAVFSDVAAAHATFSDVPWGADEVELATVLRAGDAPPLSLLLSHPLGNKYLASLLARGDITPRGADAPAAAPAAAAPAMRTAAPPSSDSEARCLQLWNSLQPPTLRPHLDVAPPAAVAAAVAAAAADSGDAPDSPLRRTGASADVLVRRRVPASPGDDETEDEDEAAASSPAAAASDDGDGDGGDEEGAAWAAAARQALDALAEEEAELREMSSEIAPLAGVDGDADGEASGAARLVAACEARLRRAAAAERFGCSVEYRLLRGHLGGKAARWLGAAAGWSPGGAAMGERLRLSEGVATAGSADGATLRADAIGVRPSHVTLHVGALTVVAIPVAGAAVYRRGERGRGRCSCCPANRSGSAAAARGSDLRARRCRRRRRQRPRGSRCP